MSQSLALVSTSFTPEVKKPFTKRFLSIIPSIFSFSDSSDFQSSSTTSSRSDRGGNKKFFFFIPVVLIALALLFVLFNYMRSNNSAHGVVAGAKDERIDVKDPIAKQTINRTFTFPLKDAAGKELSQLKMVLTDAELQDEIIIKGQKATSVKGKVFLIINLKLTNNYSKPIQINTRDYIRLTVNNSDEKLAADIHNDPVEVQAISTKYTRLGFPIDDTDKNLVLHVGEINGKKETVQLNLKK